MKHIVKQGECLSSLAATFGLKSWKDLHDHPDNAELKKKRPNPNVLAPGDEVVLPDSVTDPKTVSCATGKEYLFVVQAPKVRLRIFLQNWKGEPYTDKRFEATIEGKKVPGRTDAAGLIDVPVPACAEAGHLKVWFDEDPGDPSPNIDLCLDLGHLDPSDCVKGVQARLQNLGYHCDVNGELNDATLAAARAYRGDVGLEDVEDDALIDDALRSSLLKLHDGE